MAVVLRVTCAGGGGGQCDAKCYNGEDARCVCVCQGLNHGVGETQALANLRELANLYRGKVDVLTVDTDPRENQCVLPGVLDE